MKLLGFVVTLSGSFCLVVSLRGDEVTTCQSPDKKFALHCVYADKQPYNGEAAIVDLETHKNVFTTTIYRCEPVKIEEVLSVECGA